jgi:hypothetical protein
MEKQIFEIYDDITGKSLLFVASSYEQAEKIASKIDFEEYKNGDIVE